MKPGDAKRRVGATRVCVQCGDICGALRAYGAERKRCETNGRLYVLQKMHVSQSAPSVQHHRFSRHDINANIAQVERYYTTNFL